jgi:hypothetical protein
LPLIWAQIEDIWAQIWSFGEETANLCFAAKEVENQLISKGSCKSLPSSGRGAKKA